MASSSSTRSTVVDVGSIFLPGALFIIRFCGGLRAICGCAYSPTRHNRPQRYTCRSRFASPPCQSGEFVSAMSFSTSQNGPSHKPPPVSRVLRRLERYKLSEDNLVLVKLHTIGGRL